MKNEKTKAVIIETAEKDLPKKINSVYETAQREQLVKLLAQIIVNSVFEKASEKEITNDSVKE